MLSKCANKPNTPQNVNTYLTLHMPMQRPWSRLMKAASSYNSSVRIAEVRLVRQMFLWHNDNEGQHRGRAIVNASKRQLQRRLRPQLQRRLRLQLQRRLRLQLQRRFRPQAIDRVVRLVHPLRSNVPHYQPPHQKNVVSHSWVWAWRQFLTAPTSVFVKVRWLLHQSST